MKITLTRAEGPTAECGTKSASSFEEADAILSRWALTAPKGGGYDKCDIDVLWEDGLMWSYRFDLTNDGTEGDGRYFKANLERRLKFYSGRGCNHLTLGKYKSLLRHVPELASKLAAKILDTHFTSSK
jgi:hypothetical protein